MKFSLRLMICLAASGLILNTLPAQAESDKVLQALSDELDRTMKSLRIEKKASPYFVFYRVADDERLRLNYELGKQAEEETVNERILDVELRVGDHKFDNNAGLVGGNTQRQSRFVALDDNYDEIRRQLWILTDDIYKEASEDFEKQQTYKRGHVVRNLVDSFSYERALVQIEEPGPKLNLKIDWNDRLSKLSSVFAKYPAIRKSWVVLEADSQTFRIANSEGTRVRAGWTPIVIGLTAFARCPDGEDVWDCEYFRALDEKDLPSQQEMEERARRLAENLTAYSKTNRKNYYFGPVMFEPQAAAELLQHGIAPKLCAVPGDNLHPSGTFIRSIGTRVLPKFLNITDDPGLVSWNDKKIAGPYTFDDQGVRSEKVKLVDHGFLKALLSSRTPVLPQQTSNGHTFGDQVTPTTLMMTADKGITNAVMHNRLLQLAHDQGLKEAIVIKRIVPQTARLLQGEVSSARADSLSRTVPIEAYTIDLVTGKQTPVRGLRFRPFDLGSMQNIVAAGNDPALATTVTWAGTVRNVIAPSLLINHMELEEDERDTLTPYPLDNPYFASK